MPSYSSRTDCYYSYRCLVGKIVEHCFDEMKEKLRAEDWGEMKFQERWPEEMHKRGEERDEEHIEALKSQKDKDQSIKKQQSGKKETRRRYLLFTLKSLLCTGILGFPASRIPFFQWSDSLLPPLLVRFGFRYFCKKRNQHSFVTTRFGGNLPHTLVHLLLRSVPTKNTPPSSIMWDFSQQLHTVFPRRITSFTL